MSDYGYARVSTSKQNLERQIRNIKDEYPDAIIVKEKYTGTKISRPEWDKLNRKLKSGDRVIFDSVSRMSRDAAEGFRLYKDLMERGIELIFLHEHHIDTRELIEQQKRTINLAVDSGDAATDEFISSLVGIMNQYLYRIAERNIELAFEQAEKEVEEIHRRIREGLQTSRLNGVRIGGVPGPHRVKKAEEAKPIILRKSRTFGGNLSDVELQAYLSSVGLAVARKTYYLYKSQLKEEYPERVSCQ